MPQTILITGAGTRLGKILASHLGSSGNTIALHYHSSAEGADEVRTQLSQLGTRAECFKADLSIPAECSNLITEVNKKLGPISVLINSAALFDRHPFAETPLSSLDAQWNLNTRAPFLLSQSFARQLPSSEQGHIINILDIGGVFNFWKNYSAYCMTKAALAALTKCLALELAPRVRVNGVAPGTVLPPDSMTASELEAMRKSVPMAQFPTPEEVAQTVEFLLGATPQLTGQILAVDGGRSLSSSTR